MLSQIFHKGKSNHAPLKLMEPNKEKYPDYTCLRGVQPILIRQENQLHNQLVARTCPHSIGNRIGRIST
jgi:hypothetical protein